MADRPEVVVATAEAVALSVALASLDGSLSTQWREETFSVPKQWMDGCASRTGRSERPGWKRHDLVVRYRLKGARIPVMTQSRHTCVLAWGLLLGVIQCERGKSTVRTATPDAAPLHTGSADSDNLPQPVSPDASLARPREAAVDLGPLPPNPTASERALAIALAGSGSERLLGRFWIPRDEGVTPLLVDDVLLDPDGRFTNHIHEHPGLVGRWRVEGDTLTFYDQQDVELIVIKSVRVSTRTLYGYVDGRPARFRRVDP
jgi:hypothetical protein